jgi:hypothetical protein
MILPSKIARNGECQGPPETEGLFYFQSAAFPHSVPNTRSLRGLRLRSAGGPDGSSTYPTANAAPISKSSGTPNSTRALSASNPPIPCAWSPRALASIARFASAAPVSCMLKRFGFPFCSKVFFATVMPTRNAFPAQPWLKGTSSPSTFANCSGSAWVAIINRQGCSPKQEAAQRAASKRLRSVSASIGRLVKDRGLHRFARAGSKESVWLIRSNDAPCSPGDTGQARI